MTKNQKGTQEFKFEKTNPVFLKSKIAIFYPLASMKDVQAEGKAFNPKKKTSSNSKHDIFFWVMFGFLDTDPDQADQNQCGSMRIWINIKLWRYLRSELTY
jgi:hypothetical protein